MTTTKEQTVCDIIAARDNEMRADLAAHVAIPTGHNHTPGLDEYRDIVTSRLHRLGAETEIVAGDAKPDWLLIPRWHGSPDPCEGVEGSSKALESRTTTIPPTAVVRRPRPGSKRILIAGHLDTVFPPDGSFLRMTVAPDGKTAVGPGVVDMKGGILVALVALEALEEAGVDVSWTFTLNSDEETGTFHSSRVLKTEATQHDIGLALEPALPDGSLVVERKGAGQFRVEAVGRSAHAGREFEKGVSAVYALAHALTKIEAMSDLERGTTVNVGPITGGAATNAVPDSAFAWGNVRFTDRAAADEFADKLDTLINTNGSLPHIRIEHTLNRPAKPLTPDVQRLADAAREVAESLGQQLPFASTGGVCDGNILQAAGLPTIDTLGVRGGGLHTHDEWIELASLVERAQLLACLIARLSQADK